MSRFIATFCISLIMFLLISVDSQAQRTRVPGSGGRGSTGNGNAEIQKPTGKKITDKMFIGGNVGANFGRGFGFAEVSPLIGYMATDQLAIAAGPIYQYISFQGTAFHTFGPRITARQDILNNFFLQGEFSSLTVRSGEYKCSYRRLPLGAGARISGNGRSFFYGALLYDVLFKADGGVGYSSCPIVGNNGSPIIYRLGVSLGL